MINPSKEAQIKITIRITNIKAPGDLTKTTRGFYTINAKHTVCYAILNIIRFTVYPPSIG